MRLKHLKVSPLILVIFVFGIVPNVVFAQKDISGTVILAEKNTPLEGATIFENISKNSTVTGRDGSFKLRVATNAKNSALTSVIFKLVFIID